MSMFYDRRSAIREALVPSAVLLVLLVGIPCGAVVLVRILGR